MNIAEIPMGPDPMLDELYRIRDEISECVESLNPAERVAWFNRAADDLAARLGASWEPSPLRHAARLRLPARPHGDGA